MSFSRPTSTQNSASNSIYIDDYFLEAHLLIGADGANSWLRQAANIATVNWSHQQSALVATIKSQLPHNNIASQRFAQGGPLAFLPLDDPYLSTIVWSEDPIRVKNLMALDPASFCNILTQEFDYVLGDLTLVGTRADFPLYMLHAKEYIAQRIALIGDAAHVLHPLAGQGLNLGILDAASLAQIIENALAKAQDIGQAAILRKYARWRKGHNLSMLALVEFFKRAFAINNSILSDIRDIGMHRINNSGKIKSSIIRFAMGLQGDLPHSAQKNLQVQISAGINKNLIDVNN